MPEKTGRVELAESVKDLFSLEKSAEDYLVCLRKINNFASKLKKSENIWHA
jgi:hypothetical protein